MSHRFFWFGALICVIVTVTAYHVVDHDLDTAASHKHEWEKGDDEHHYDEEHEEKGEKAEKGYKGEHGWVLTRCQRQKPSEICCV